MQRAVYVLPVGGGAGVEDVLFGREQRQAVGIKVDRLRAHDGKSFQTTPAASLLTFPDGFWGRSICCETATAEHWGSRTQQQSYAAKFMQCGLIQFQMGAICTGAAHSQRERDCDCTLVQRGRIRLHHKAPPPVERVESVMTSLARSLWGNGYAYRSLQSRASSSSGCSLAHSSIRQLVISAHCVKHSLCLKPWSYCTSSPSFTENYQQMNDSWGIITVYRTIQ